MPSVTVFRWRFTPSLGMSLCTLFGIVLFMRLGMWQLHRAAEKTAMLQAQSLQSQQSPVEWFGGQDIPPIYKNIRVSGYFLPITLLLDNQFYQHQFGYDVLSPLVLANGGVVLIDRGWIIGDPLRSTYPVIKAPTGVHVISGQVYIPTTKSWLLGAAVESQHRSNMIVERVDVDKISQLLHKSVYPFMIRLGPQESFGYVREWSVVAMSPQRHNGYAVQWFAMALVLLIIYIALNIKKKS